MTRVAGIDPGRNGAICVLDSSNLNHIALYDLNKGNVYDATKWLHNQQVERVFIEDVHSLFGMSAKSNFGFGKQVGFSHAIAQIVTQGKLPDMVTPKVWQKYVGVTAKGKDIKAQVAEIVHHLYPGANLHGPKGSLLDGRSDAVMIAHYGINNL